MDDEIHPKRAAALEQIEAQELEEVVLLDGHDHAIIGLVKLPNGSSVLAYSTRRILDSLVADGMTEGDAQEHFDFNIGCPHAGPGTPVFVQDERGLPL